MSNSNKCSNVNEVFYHFNLMQDGRSFTDYRPQSELYNFINKRASNFCENTENSNDHRVCLQRNAGFIFMEDKKMFDTVYNLPKCEKASACGVKKNNNKNN